jgi:hypothetical protein
MVSGKHLAKSESNMKRLPLVAVLLSALYLFTACGSDLTRVADTRENAFSLELPEDWQNFITLERPYDQVRNCAVSISPDQRSRLFFGDPNLPTFALPNPQMYLHAGMNTGSPLFQVRNFQPADQFFADYMNRTYGQLENFQLIETAPNPFYQQAVEEMAAEENVQAHITTTKIRFSYTDQGEEVQGVINGMTLQVQEIWMAGLYGFTTMDDTEEMEALSRQALASYEIHPEWQEQENLRNQQKMQQQTAAHQRRMQQQQQNFQAHQNRMQQRYNAADAQYNNWRQNQAAQDLQHDRFIDNIRDKETVTNGSYSGKVDAGYNNYYVDPNTGNYIGTNIQENPDISVYEHWKIRR